MAFYIMEVWAKYGSGIIVVVIHSVWKYPATSLKDHSVLCRICKYLLSTEGGTQGFKWVGQHTQGFRSVKQHGALWEQLVI